MTIHSQLCFVLWPIQNLFANIFDLQNTGMLLQSFHNWKNPIVGNINTVHCRVSHCKVTVVHESNECET